MSLDHARVRHAAKCWRTELGFETLTVVPAARVLAAAEQATGYRRVALRSGDPLLASARAVLDRQFRTIWQDESASSRQRSLDAAHEFGHHALHTASSASLFGEPAVDEQCGLLGYSPRERREQEADLFAREFLAPLGLVVHLFFDKRFPARQIARLLGIDAGVVKAQLASSLLENSCRLPPTGTGDDLLNIDQKAAVETTTGPFFLRAGPGTGKTRTLVARCRYLVYRCKQPAGSIHVLSFSRSAADEVRLRLQSERLSAISVTTFHALGLDILQKYSSEACLPVSWKIVSTERRQELLREAGGANLGRLDSFVTHAKCRLRKPDYWLPALKRKQDLCAESDDPRASQAARELELLIRGYHAYQVLLAEHGLIDTEDLIVRSVDLLNSRKHVRLDLHARLRNLLVDEYQDLNPSCLRLLDLLAGHGKRLWLVGDTRQSIFGFRGSAGGNEAAHIATRDLRTNYRSQAGLLPLLQHVARGITVESQRSSTLRWHSSRPALSHARAAVTRVDAADETEQINSIAAVIRDGLQLGYSLRDHAVLCRTNAQAAQMRTELNALFPAIVRPKGLWDQPEVKDLMSWLSLCCRPSAGPDLLRVAIFSEYALPEHLALDLARRFDRATGQDEQLSLYAPPGDGNDGIPLTVRMANLGRAFRRCRRGTSLINVLDCYLFEVSDYLRTGNSLDTVARFRAELRTASSASQSFNNDPAIQLDEFESRARTDWSAGEYRMPSPENSAGQDELQIMTIHAAKGSEFPIVFVPNLSTGLFPTSSHDTPVEEWEEQPDEEGNLFFVAISRAKDYVVLSRPVCRDGRELPPSPLLKLIDGLPGVDTKKPVAVSPHSHPSQSTDFSRAEPQTPVGRTGLCSRQTYYSELFSSRGSEDVALPPADAIDPAICAACPYFWLCPM